MARHTITLIPGDGVGPEVSDAARRVIDATGVGIDWEVHDAGLGVMEQYGDPLPPHVLDSIRRNKVAIKGPLTTPVGKGIRSVNVALRRELDLYALVRPCKSYPGVRSRYQDVDLVIVRENNEGFQPDRNVVAGSGEFRPTHDVTISVRVITRNGSSKVAREAFELARTRDKRLTVVHKDTVFKLGKRSKRTFSTESARFLKAGSGMDSSAVVDGLKVSDFVGHEVRQSA